MKAYSVDWQAALDLGDAMTAGAVKIATSDPFRVWTGDGSITLDGEVYVGIGSAGMIRATGSQLGGAEQAIELILSGVDPDIIPLIEAADVRGARVTVWRLGFDGSGLNLLDANVFARGKVDTLPREETPGGTATIRCLVETAARGLGRNTGRMRSDADHRMVEATDGAFQRVSQAAELTLAWGGKPPARAGVALPNGQTVGGGALGGGQTGFGNFNHFV
ncbi:hypothetical protein [Phenylobacterium sp.]|uniref:hypothetical protein n=1 Tax=Phenylobacterium sp. TaxID=1871053 RepID=UPI0027361A05|nr:hypothetical protein [Phenylobacterium sp.]MDP3853148.1 hypothetical protein [Phenylobacterium sp.]